MMTLSSHYIQPEYHTRYQTFIPWDPCELGLALCFNVGNSYWYSNNKNWLLLIFYLKLGSNLNPHTFSNNIVSTFNWQSTEKLWNKGCDKEWNYKITSFQSFLKSIYVNNIILNVKKNNKEEQKLCIFTLLYLVYFSGLSHTDFVWFVGLATILPNFYFSFEFHLFIDI